MCSTAVCLLTFGAASTCPNQLAHAEDDVERVRDAFESVSSTAPRTSDVMLEDWQGSYPTSKQALTVGQE